MTSILSAFPFIGEQSFATPGAFNSPLSTISANIAAINADVGAISGVTISPPSGNTIQMPSDLSISGYLSVGKGVSIGTQAPGTPEPVALTIGVNSGISDYIYFNDTANLRSDYLMGSHAGGTADGLNIFDVSGNTMIASFSKQSIRFYQKVVGPVIDASGAVFNVLSYGAVCDGVTDDRPAIDLAISTAAATGGGVVFFPGSRSTVSFYLVGSPITISTSNIRLQGTGWNMQATPTAPPSLIRGPTVLGPIITTPSGTTIFGLSIIDLGCQGNSTVSTAAGVVINDAYELYVERCFFDNFGGSAISLSNNVIGATLQSLFAQNCLKAPQAANAGVYDLSATDVRAFGCFANISATTIEAGTKYAFAIRSGPGMYYGCMGDQANHGWLVTGGAGLNRFLGCRAFQNKGNGFAVTGGPGNTFVGCLAIANGQAAHNTYAGFRITGYQNQFTSCYIDGLSGDTILQSNGFDDLNSNGNGESVGNRYVGNSIGNNVAGVLYNMTGATPYRIEHPHSISSNRGDSTVTVQAGADQETQLFGTVLTSNRTVNFSNTGAWKGARFTVLRTAAATGTPTLWVAGAQLLPGQAAEVEYTGSAWQLMRVGLADGTTLSAASGTVLTVHSGTTLAASWMSSVNVLANKLGVNTPIGSISAEIKGQDTGTSAIVQRNIAATNNGVFLWCTDGASWNASFGAEDGGDFSWYDQRYGGNAGNLNMRLRTTGQLLLRAGSASIPTYAISSETSLGLYASGASTIAQSYGTFNLATNAVRLSMRTIAASALTASAANTNVAVNEAVFTIQASGASFVINSGGTTWIFNSSASAKNT